LPLHQPRTTRWVHGLRPNPRYTADCHGPGGAEPGEPVLAPLTGHHGTVKAVAVGEPPGQSVIVSGSRKPHGLRC